MLQFRSWTFTRILRALIGLAILIDGVVTSETFITVIGGLLLLQAFTNTGCEVGGNCSIPLQEDEQKPKDELVTKE